MENLELKAKLSAKLLKLESEIPYLKAEGKGLKGGKILEIESILHNIRPVMTEIGLKLNTEIVNVENREIQKQKSNEIQLILVTNAVLNFTWTDTETGYSDTKIFHGSWCNYDNYGFALGSILTYFKRQYLFHELNIESDEYDAEIYQQKHMTEAEKTEAFRKKLKSDKKTALMQMPKAKDSKELNFIWAGLNDELKKDQEIKQSFENSRDTIIITAINNCKNKGDLANIRSAVKTPSASVEVAIVKKENSFK